MKNIIANMLVEVLSILAVATKEIRQCRMSESLCNLNASQLTEPCQEKWLKKLIGKAYIENALRRLDKVTQEESRMSTSRVLKAIISSMNEDVKKNVAEIAYGMQTSVNHEEQSDAEVPRWKGCRGSQARKNQRRETLIISQTY